eukprot:tig00020904_g15138.t1
MQRLTRRRTSNALTVKVTDIANRNALNPRRGGNKDTYPWVAVTVVAAVDEVADEAADEAAVARWWRTFIAPPLGITANDNPTTTTDAPKTPATTPAPTCPSDTTTPLTTGVPQTPATTPARGPT